MKNQQKVIELFYKMLRVRVFEEKIADLYEKGYIKGKIYMSIGQEAVSAGAILALGGEDKIFSTHRNFASCICSEMDIKKMLKEILGMDGGYNFGKAGPFYLADTEVGNYGSAPLPAGNTSVSLGVALASKIRGEKDIVLSFIGDGASSEGGFFESVNMASILKLPVVFLIENNEYANCQSLKYNTNNTNLASRASGYNMPGVIIDGNNAIDVYTAMSKAISYVRSGKGPILVEAKTYRFSGHHLGDKTPYRNQKEVDEWFERCPIKILSNFMVENGIGTKEDLYMMKSKISEDIEEIINDILIELEENKGKNIDFTNEGRQGLISKSSEDDDRDIDLNVSFTDIVKESYGIDLEENKTSPLNEMEVISEETTYVEDITTKELDSDIYEEENNTPPIENTDTENVLREDTEDEEEILNDINDLVIEEDRSPLNEEDKNKDIQNISQTIKENKDVLDTLFDGLDFNETFEKEEKDLLEMVEEEKEAEESEVAKEIEALSLEEKINSEDKDLDKAVSVAYDIEDLNDEFQFEFEVDEDLDDDEDIDINFINRVGGDL